MKTAVKICVATDEELLIAKEMGDIDGYTTSGQQVTLKDVLYVPNLRENLISVRKLTKAGLEVVFKNNKATILHRGRDLVIAEAKGNGANS